MSTVGLKLDSSVFTASIKGQGDGSFVHPTEDRRRPAARIARINPELVVVDEDVAKDLSLHFLHGHPVAWDPVQR